MIGPSKRPWWLVFLAAAIWLAPGPARAAAGAPADLSTPRRALRYFVDEARAGRFAAAASVLDLSGASPEIAGQAPGRLAWKLKLVLDQTLWIDWTEVSDAPRGNPADGASTDLVGEIPANGTKVPFRMARLEGPDGKPVWKIARGTVDAIPRLYARYGAGWVGEVLPPIFFRIRVLEIEAWQWLGLGLSLAAALLVALLLGGLLRRLFLRIARRTRVAWDDRLVAAASGPVKLLIGLGVFALGAALCRLAVPPSQVVDRIVHTVLVLGLTWAALRGAGFVAHLLESRLTDRETDAGRRRGAQTQILVLHRVVTVVIVILGGSLVLLQFDGLRSIGTSLLASAGVAGIVIGLAAQKSISTLLAGIQISITQPIRIDDVVIVDGEWGTIEEITLTYVVLKVWDLRRLVVPIHRFLDTAFQNWTKVAPDLLGTVYLHADYTVPVERVREEVAAFVKARPEWDGKAVGLVVTDTTDRTVELRALVSTADSGKLWDLRCALREHLVAFLQTLDGGAYLPRTRVDAPDLTQQGEARP